MYVVVQHQISDPGTFWSKAKVALATLPAGAELCQSLPNADGSQCVCLWSADAVDTVKELIESAVGHVSHNEYYAVNPENAVGLPES